MNELQVHRILQTSADQQARAVLISLRLGEKQKATRPRGSAGIKFHPLTARGRVY